MSLSGKDSSKIVKWIKETNTAMEVIKDDQKKNKIS